MIQLYVTVLFLTALGGTSKAEIACGGGFKFIQNGKNVSLNCLFSYSDSPVVSWFKQTPGEKPVLIASSFRFSSDSEFHNNFNKSGRFSASREKDTFTLSISNVEASDSATYYCGVSYYAKIELSDCTILVLKDAPSSLYTVLQHPVSDPVQLGGDTTLQCSILTDNSAGDHSVYWFRHGSGESDPGIIFTHGNRSDQCKKSSETASPTQSCVYKLPKNNLSLSDAGTYYCAVAACGHIIFGNGTTLNFDNPFLMPVVIFLATSNIIFIVVVLFLWRKLHLSHQKDAAKGHTLRANQIEDTGDLNYAALSFTQPPSSRRSRTKNSSDQPVYSQVKIRQ